MSVSFQSSPFSTDPIQGLIIYQGKCTKDGYERKYPYVFQRDGFSTAPENFLYYTREGVCWHSPSLNIRMIQDLTILPVVEKLSLEQLKKVKEQIELREEQLKHENTKERFRVTFEVEFNPFDHDSDSLASTDSFKYWLGYKVEPLIRETFNLREAGAVSNFDVEISTDPED